MAYIKKKEKEGHLKTKTISFGKKGYISKPAKTKEIIEVRPKKKKSWISKKQKEDIGDTVKKTTSWINKKNYSNK